MSALSRPAALALAMLVATLGALPQAQPAWAQPATRPGNADSQVEPKLFDLVMRTREARLAGNNQAWLENGRRVLAMAPEHPDLLISVGRALAANGRVDEGLDHLADAIRRGAGFNLNLAPREVCSKSQFFGGP